jgi:hypothetical protein
MSNNGAIANSHMYTAVLSTLLHSIAYVFTQFAECTGTDFIFVGCILLRNVHEESFRHIPAIATENFIDVIISVCITTCFGPYGPSSGEYNYHLKHLRESHRYNNNIIYIYIMYIISNKFMNNGSVGIMMAFSKMF